MRVIEEPFFGEVEAQRRANPGPERHPGLHLSDVIREIERDLLGDEARPEKATDPAQTARLMQMWEQGLIFEEALEWAMALRYTRGRPEIQFGLGAGAVIVRPVPWRRSITKQFQVEMDGIWMTPDAYDREKKRVEEYKWTKKSTKHIGDWEKSFAGYLIQMKSYCRYYRCLKSKLFVQFVNGNYKYGTPEGANQMRSFCFEYSRQEVEDNWLWVLAKKREMEERGKGKGPVGKPYRKPEVPPFPAALASRLAATSAKGDPQAQDETILSWMGADLNTSMLEEGDDE